MAPVTPVSGASDASTPESPPDQGAASGQSPTISIAGMAVVPDLMSVHKRLIGNYHDLSALFIPATDTRSLGYCQAYLLIDGYSRSTLEDRTRQLRTADRSSDRVDGNIPIKYLKSFLYIIVRKHRRGSLCTLQKRLSSYAKYLPSVIHTNVSSRPIHPQCDFAVHRRKQIH